MVVEVFRIKVIIIICISIFNDSLNVFKRKVFFVGFFNGHLRRFKRAFKTTTTKAF